MARFLQFVKLLLLALLNATQIRRAALTPTLFSDLAPTERRYAHAFWRYLLGWEPFPTSPDTLSFGRAAILRGIVRFRIDATKRGPATILAWPIQPKEEETP